MNITTYRPGTVEQSSQKTCDRSVQKAPRFSVAETRMGSLEIGRCQSSLPCQASTACPLTGTTEQNEKNTCLGSPQNISKIGKTDSICLFWDKPGWCSARPALPAEHGPKHRVHSTTCATLEGKLWTTCCCLPPALTPGHLQRGCSSRQTCWHKFHILPDNKVL